VIAIVAKRKSSPSPRSRLKAILASLDDDKAEDVATVSLAGKSSLADFMVVATGRSQRHVATLAEHLETRLKALGLTRVPIEGLRVGEWVVVDTGDVIVHLFQAEARAHYGIEKMWSVTVPQAKNAAGRKTRAQTARRASRKPETGSR
jgi:ribosome-associated protein